MLVVVQGDPLQLASTVVGLDILGPRHPKLHSLLVARLGFQTAPDSQVGQGGDRCPLGDVSGTTTVVIVMSLWDYYRCQSTPLRIEYTSEAKVLL